MKAIYFRSNIIMNTRIMPIVSYFKLMILILFAHSFAIDKICGEKTTKCDFHKYPKGCRYSETQECDTASHACKCRPEYPIGLPHGICLARKSIDDGCMGSIQCKHVLNAGCYGLDTEFKDDFWIQLWHKFGHFDPGKCNCDLRKRFIFNASLNACVKELVIGKKCSGNWTCYSKVANSFCISGRCECDKGYYYEPLSDSCKIPLNYGNSCVSSDGCFSSLLMCDNGVCRCNHGYHFDKYSNPECQPNASKKCPNGYLWNEKVGACIDSRIDISNTIYSNHIQSDFELIEPPRFYSIFVILALWICLLFILGNAKRGIRLVEQAVRRDQASQYRQCDIQSTIESHQFDQQMIASQVSLQSSISSSINQCYPPPSFEELYPSSNSSQQQQYADEPPRYEDVVMLDKAKDLVV